MCDTDSAPTKSHAHCVCTTNTPQQAATTAGTAARRGYFRRLWARAYNINKIVAFMKVRHMNTEGVSTIVHSFSRERER